MGQRTFVAVMFSAARICRSRADEVKFACVIGSTSGSLRPGCGGGSAVCGSGWHFKRVRGGGPLYHGVLFPVHAAIRASHSLKSASHSSHAPSTSRSTASV